MATKRKNEHPYEKEGTKSKKAKSAAKSAPQFKFGSAGSPKKAGKVGQAATPGTTTKADSAMRAPSLQASNPKHKHKKFNNFALWTVAMVANFLGFSVEEKDGKKVPKVEKLVKAKSWTNNRGEAVQPKQPWKLNQYGKDGLYFDALLKIFQVLKIKHKKLKK